MLVACSRKSDAPAPSTDPKAAPANSTTTRAAGSPAKEPAADDVKYTGSFTGASGTHPITVGTDARKVYTYLPVSRTARPALVVVLHGTGANESEGAMDGAIGELSAREAADANGFILLAPYSSSDGGTNADHESGGPGWRFDGDASTNRDLLLLRASIQEARKAFKVDATHVYLVGHSNGAFFSYFAAVKLADRIAAFAESSGGIIPCGNRADCMHTAAGSTNCAGLLRTAPEACRCPITAAPFPTPRGSGRVPSGFLKHNADDTTVSAVYSCRLAEQLGARARVSIDPKGEHGPTNDFMAKAWVFLASKSLAD
jgi:poly(3-hydroxybutyrate) depolymerase